MVKNKLSFKQKLQSIQIKNNSLVCVGLDSDVEKIPDRFKLKKYPQFEFNKWTIDQVAEFVCAFKPNLAFYEARGSQGWLELEKTMDYLHQNYPEIVTIADAKRADIGSTNDGYVKAIFDRLGFDAVTLHPYLGREALEPFLNRKDKGCIILCRTSNEGAGEIQDVFSVIPLKKGIHSMGIKKETDSGSRSDQKILRRSGSSHLTRNASYFAKGFGRTWQDDKGSMKSLLPLWQHVAIKVSEDWDKNDNCLLVVGATYPQELKVIRSIVGDMDLLVPGIGAQGGDLQAIMKVGLNSQGRGMIINSARGIIFANNPASEAKKLKNEINKFRE